MAKPCPKKSQPARRSRRLRKKSPLRASSCGAIKRSGKCTRKCPRCGGLGRLIKKKKTGCGRIRNNLFPQFFRYVCWRLRKQRKVQSGCETMIQAAECWRLLTPEQKDEFKQRLQNWTLYSDDTGSSPPPPPPPGCGGGCGQTGGQNPFSFPSFPKPGTTNIPPNATPEPRINLIPAGSFP